MFEANPIITRTSHDYVGGRVTFNGVIHRTGILVLIAMTAFAVSWIGTGGGFAGVPADTFSGLSMVAAIGGLVLGLVIIFTRSCNPYLISAYAAGEGFLLGTISRVAETSFPGIAFETATATFGIFFLVLVAYRLRILRATPALVKIVTVGLIAVAGFYLWDMIGGFFGHPLSIVRGNSNASIWFSVAIVALASISFVLDFAQAEAAVESGAAEEYSWQLSFGLLVGLVWLYIEILRLLMKVRSRRD